jgi:hypothetical protein
MSDIVPYQLASFQAQLSDEVSAVSFTVSDHDVMEMDNARLRAFMEAMDRAMIEAPAHGLQIIRTRDDLHSCDVFTITKAHGDSHADA